MSPVTLFLSLTHVVALALSASVAMAQAPPLATYPAVPLAQKGPYTYPDGIPYKVDTDVNLIRGTQIGYNICNSTTQNQESLCQTSFLNALDDFCLWAPAETGHSVGDIEGSMIAWCTKPGHGTRLIPEGALTGVQYTKTPDYVQVVGFIDQTKINIMEGDYGGEMDPHGADLRGNPMGGIMFSDKFTGQPIQAIEWHNFIGSNTFCLKLCDPRGANDDRYCEHIFDRIGCKYNAPNEARNGTFEACEGESQDFPGIYTGADGVTSTYTQPPESLGPITTVTYEPRIPRSSNCVAFESKSIYTGLPTASVAGASSSATSATSQATGGSSNSATSRSSGSSSNSAAPSTQTDTSGAAQVVGSSFAIVGAVFGAAMLLA